VTLVSQARVSLSTEGEIAGYRVAKPMIDIHTIGAGGGSIAWPDGGGMLRVGPASAGSDPGPVCYELGGERPTVTDANLILGYLNKDYFLGGEMKVSEEKARAAMRRHIGEPLGLDEVEAAAGVFRIINQSMADATKVVSVQRGHDPREYALVSAGGACSIHACKIAEEVGCRTVIVPRAASVFCALGMLESDIRLDHVRTFNARVPGIDLAAFNEVIRQVEARALSELLSMRVERGRATLLRQLDVRYVGQHHEVTIDIPHGQAIRAEHLPGIAEAFHRAHERLYTYATPENPLEVMNLRVTAVGAVDKAELTRRGLAAGGEQKARKGERQAWFAEAGGFLSVPVYDRERLAPGHRLPGPAIVEERITTVVVHPGWALRVDEYENLLLEAAQ
jgi:N-methylhydantoinase A